MPRTRTYSFFLRQVGHMLRHSYLVTCNRIPPLLDEIEELYANAFTEGDAHTAHVRQQIVPRYHKEKGEVP